MLWSCSLIRVRGSATTSTISLRRGQTCLVYDWWVTYDAIESMRKLSQCIKYILTHREQYLTFASSNQLEDCELEALSTCV
jgi:hypothetical protein